MKKKEIQSLLNRLNSWGKKETERYERQGKHPEYIVHGETVAWIEGCKKTLKNLGVFVIWDDKKKKYKVKK